MDGNLHSLKSKEVDRLYIYACTVGNKAIKKPLLCYDETTWQYARRMASHFNQPVIADVKTGKPSFWFGVREGEYFENHCLVTEQIQLEKLSGDRVVVSYLLKGKENYELGDQLLVDGERKVVYQKEVQLKHGEIKTVYLAANQDVMFVETYYQPAIAGLSMKGIVERAENESVYITLDADGKTGKYPFSWYPETGNVLYAMPEAGAVVELYFMSCDEQEVIAVRCRDTETDNSDIKLMKTLCEAEMELSDSGVRLSRKDKMAISEERINFNGINDLEMSAGGTVKIKARTIEIEAPKEIKYVTE